MSMAEKMFSLKIEKLVENEKNFEFPLYMRLLRKSIGFSRRFVADTIGCSETKILYLEKGDYGTRGPDYEFIVTMAHFYGLNGNRILKKFRKYMTTIRSDKKKKNHNPIDFRNLSSDVFGFLNEPLGNSEKLEGE